MTVKHPVMAGRQADVQATLRSPSEIRVSKRDPNVFLFYKPERIGRWVCAVTKRLDGDGFLVTTYPTDAIKEGVRIWPKRDVQLFSNSDKTFKVKRLSTMTNVQPYADGVCQNLATLMGRKRSLSPPNG